MEKVRKDLTVVHISDLHFGQEKSVTRNSFNLLSAIAEKYKNSAEKTIVIITGDIWNSFTLKDKNTAVKMFKESKLFEVFPRENVLICPGNHDKSKYYFKNGRGEPFFFPKTFPNLSSFVVGEYKYNFIGLDSARNRKSYSKIGEDQLKFVNEVIDNVQEEREASKAYYSKKRKKKVVEEEIEGEGDETVETTRDTIPKRHRIFLYLHHHPFLSLQKKCIADRSEFVKIISGRCQGLFFGHHHRHKRLKYEEKKHKIPLILLSGKSPNLRAFREVSFFSNGNYKVKDVKLK